MKYREKITKEIKRNKNGFILLFAVTLAALLLSIALGVSNVAFRELRFSTSASSTNDAFFAADAGIECAFYYDRGEDSYDAFGGTLVTVNCGGNSNIPVSQSYNGSTTHYDFQIINLGNSAQSCAKVRVTKAPGATEQSTTIVSKGYNLGNASSCPSSTLNLVERSLEITY